MIRNAQLWAGYIRQRFIPEAEALGQAFEQKILPAFDGTKDEAARVRDEVFARSSSVADSEWDSVDMTAEAADEAGFRHYSMLMDLRQGVINLIAAGTYHLFEQQIFLLRRERVFSLAERGNNLLERVREGLRVEGIETDGFRAWPTLLELRLVANVVKHSEGDSATKLKRMRRDMFFFPDPAIRSASGMMPPPPGGSFEPLFGEGFYVTPDDFRLYIKAIAGFWEEFATWLDGHANENIENNETNGSISGG